MRNMRMVITGLFLSTMFYVGLATAPMPMVFFPKCCDPPSTGTYPCIGTEPVGNCNYGCQVNCGGADTATGENCRQGCALQG